MKSSILTFILVICTPNDFGGTGVNVVIDGVSKPMNAKPNDILYELEFDGTPNQYYYEIVGNPAISENALFNGNPRTWDPQSTTTFYEVYGRRHSVGDELIKGVPRLYPPLDGYKKYSQLFQEGEVPVIHVNIDQSQYTQLTTTENKEAKYKVEFDLYTPYEKYHFTNVTFALSGQDSKNLDKKPYKIDLSGNKADKYNSEIFNRKEFKLRSLRYDESYIKNKIVTDLAESLGLPITQSNFCRLYINNKSYGLYELADMYKKKFIKRFFNPQKNEDEVIYGSFYKGVSGDFPAYLYSDFPGSSATPDEIIGELYESIIPPTAGYDPHQDIKAMIAWAESLPETASKEEIEQKFDLDMFLKYMAIEYLICHWDGYLGNGNNFYIYIEPNNGKYHFLSYDFDSTLGKWCHAVEGTIDSYVLHVGDDSKGNPADPYGSEPKNREPLLYKKIIKNPNIKPIFDNLVKGIVQNLFNLQALGPRIDYLYEFLKDDMYWDIDTFIYKTFDTKYFADGGVQEEPSRITTDAQFSDLTNTENLKAFIKAKSENLAQILGIPKLEAKGDYGTVGEKMMTIG
ncbi:coth-domain-containing protein [Anaeromyces robustus]|uniref:Coth-domain-containing protein n=1 Tax=Anaeromyces robustus TaxID=1754192 RepID=A0A1Y1XDE0_9FUNG|nr:coth-domain-containing protein [Anaeromyces robustus]|eukprot:ORX83702.1 coth-domain-containing protein [Anaeromyces robustus]